MLPPKCVQFLFAAAFVSRTVYGDTLDARGGISEEPVTCDTNVRSSSGKGFYCNAQGSLKSPAVINNSTTPTLEFCSQQCTTNQPHCISFSYGPGQLCTTYSKRINHSGFKMGVTGQFFYNRRCVSQTCSCPNRRSTRCGDICYYDIDTNNQHCGQCDNACTGTTFCSDGSCVGFCDGQPGTTQCGSRCLDLNNTNSHCGSCDNNCGDNGENYVCSGGSCVCGPSNQYADCDNSGTCTNLLNTKEHCGSCSNSCGDNEVCDGGSCVCIDGYQRCGADNVCTDMTTNQNCGACNNACGTDSTCASPTAGCVCNSSDLTLCAQNNCYNLQTNSQHCNGCDSPCPDPTDECNSGNCITNAHCFF